LWSLFGGTGTHSVAAASASSVQWSWEVSASAVASMAVSGIRYGGPSPTVPVGVGPRGVGRATPVKIVNQEAAMGMRLWGAIVLGTAAVLAPMIGGATMTMTMAVAAADERGTPVAIPWTRDYKAAFKEAKATGRPILLNFYCGT
jgi:hypothetical protein